jgi:hypothetical protein
MLAADAANAETWSALGYNCQSNPDNLVVYPVTYDPNLVLPASRDGLFVQANQEDMPEVLNVVSCRLGSGIAVVRRVMQHQPVAHGACGAQPYARYEVLYNNVVSGTFYNGCATTIMLANENGLTICSDKCVGWSWADVRIPIRFDLFGRAEAQ